MSASLNQIAAAQQMQVDSLVETTGAIQAEIARLKNENPTVDFTTLDQLVRAPSDTDR